MFVFACCVGSDEKFHTQFLPGVQRCMEPDSLVLQVRSKTGICEAYNRVIDTVIGSINLEGIVFAHDDAEILADDFLTRVRNEIKNGAGLIGVAGATGVRNLSWWDAPTLHGVVRENHRHLDLGPETKSAHTVDGLTMVVPANTAREIRFDAEAFSRFHGYDIDYSFAVRHAGKSISILRTSIWHHTFGGYGDRSAFDAADAALRKKWTL